MGETATQPADMIVFPNPNDGGFTVRSGSSEGDWRLLATTGSEVGRGIFQSTEWKVDLPSVAPGAYVLSLIGSDGIVSQVQVMVGIASRDH